MPVSTVCGRPILHSPYDYTGKPARYQSGPAGLPTFGGSGTTFPNDTAGVILPLGKHSYDS